MKKLMMCAVVALGAACGFAQEQAEPAKPVSVLLSVYDPVQTSPSSVDVHGLELGLLWDASTNVRGMELAGGGNVVYGDLIGAQLAIGFNWIEKGGYGVMGAIGFNRAGESFGGVQWAYGANICHGDFYGFQDACSNYANVMHGVQVGFVNMSHDCHGLQVGIINTAEKMEGVQVGILNFIKESSLPFFPIVNAYF